MYIAMYSCEYTVKEVHVCVTHDTYITTTAHLLQQYCIIRPEGRGKYRHVHIYIMLCIYAQNSVYTVHMYVYTEGISVLHWPHIVTAWASLDCTTHQHTFSMTTELPCYKCALLTYTVYSAFRVSGPVHTLHTAITHVINILELGSSHEFQLQ